MCQKSHVTLKARAQYGHVIQYTRSDMVKYSPVILEQGIRFLFCHSYMKCFMNLKKELCYFRDILIDYLRFTSYELLSLRVTFIARVISPFLHMSCGLLFIARVMTYFLHTNHDLQFIARVTSYFHCVSYLLLFAYKLQVNVYHASY